jgi:hypothetical protein
MTPSDSLANHPWDFGATFISRVTPAPRGRAREGLPNYPGRRLSADKKERALCWALT